MSSTYEASFAGQWLTESPQEREAERIWCRHYVACEAHDRSLPHVPGPDGVRVLPGYSGESIRYARASHRSAQEAATALVGRERCNEIRQRVSRMRGSERERIAGTNEKSPSAEAEGQSATEG